MATPIRHEHVPERVFFFCDWHAMPVANRRLQALQVPHWPPALRAEPCGTLEETEDDEDLEQAEEDINDAPNEIVTPRLAPSSSSSSSM
jgi:hypothetical protein